MDKIATARPIIHVSTGRPTSDGAGVKLTRVLGTDALPMVDPFLMLDEFRSDDPSDYLAGFPDHPHRGFETVTYMLAGRMRHEDNQGNGGVLEAGGAQWMTAGRGIVHSEMPEQIDGLMWGFQLWINLPARAKMTAPRYQDITPAQIPAVARDGARVRVVAGAIDGTRGPVVDILTAPVFLDVALDPGARFSEALPEGHNAFAYVFEGSVAFAGRALARGQIGVFGPGDGVAVESEEGGRFILLAASPLNEPVARYGPFVMNTKEQIYEAFRDYEAGKL